ncbi:MAG TPA: expansin EXLX1 family cellulose-binding protein [Streptosporangiaceae bacterium]|nr:expansin EXLX1 family cellulose-binding protein [Streptosporangiaceae bacterium]
MHSAPRPPAPGNRVWLIGGVLGGAAALSTAFVLFPTAHGCPRPAAGRRAATGQLTATRAGNATPTPGPTPAASRATAVSYDPGDGAGSCTLGPLPASGSYVSLPPRRFARGAACGSYLEVRGPLGQVRAEVVQECNRCEATTISLSRAAFQRVASLADGPMIVTFWPVTDPPLPGPVELRVRLTPSGRRAVAVVNHGNRLASVAVGSHAGAGPWQALALGAHGLWVSTHNLGRGPFTVAVTDGLGHRAVLTGVRMFPGTLVRSSIWMYRPVHQEARKTSRAPQLAGGQGRPTGCS